MSLSILNYVQMHWIKFWNATLQYIYCIYIIIILIFPFQSFSCKVKLTPHIITTSPTVSQTPVLSQAPPSKDTLTSNEVVIDKGVEQTSSVVPVLASTTITATTPVISQIPTTMTSDAMDVDSGSMIY